MRPTLKRTIFTSKTTGRRYYLGKSTKRSNGRRYYVCSQPDCDGRLVRESDVFCRVHTQVTTSDDGVNEEILNNHSEVVEDDTSIKETSNDTTVENDLNNSKSIIGRSRSKIKRDIHVDEITGKRSFRDGSGRRRYLCMNSSCTKVVKCQSDTYCRTHANNDEKEKNDSEEPLTSNEIPNRYRSPFATTTTTTTTPTTNGNHSDEYETLEKTEEQTGTSRSFRDASGKIRFLCSNPTCISRLVKRSDTFCKRHHPDKITKNNDNSVQSISTIDNINHDKETDNIQQTDMNHNNPDILSRQSLSETPIKKRKYDYETTLSKISTVPENKMVIATTTLLDHQWSDVLMFLRQFPEVQLSTNLNVNDSTTHLLVDDSENYLHCIITKKIVQAAVRRHVFIISSRWITKCINSNELVNEQSFEIQSDSHTILRLSIQNNEYLFNKTYAFAIECQQCQGSINRNELIELINLSGGKFYENNENENQIEILIILCDINDKNIEKIKEKYQQINISNIKYVTSDFFLKSIIKFQIQDIDKYSL